MPMKQNVDDVGWPGAIEGLHAVNVYSWKRPPPLALPCPKGYPRPERKPKTLASESAPSHTTLGPFQLRTVPAVLYPKD